MDNEPHLNAPASLVPCFYPVNDRESMHDFEAHEKAARRRLKWLLCFVFLKLATTTRSAPDVLSRQLREHSVGHVFVVFALS